jgi:hypothetical protein
MKPHYALYYYFYKISKAPAQISVLHVCGEIEKKIIIKNEVKRTCLQVANMCSLTQIWLCKVQLIWLPTFMTSISIVHFFGLSN